ncbi:MAG: type IV pilin protein [Bacillota bacterium]
MIELIVVVAILGILAAVLTPRVLDAIDNARQSGAEAFGKELQLAMERYYLDENGYPTVDTVQGSNGTLEYADLVTLLGKYTTLDASQFDTAVAAFDYDGLDSDGDPVAENVEPASYSLTIGLKDSEKTVTITPRLVTVSTN